MSKTETPRSIRRRVKRVITCLNLKVIYICKSMVGPKNPGSTTICTSVSFNVIVVTATWLTVLLCLNDLVLTVSIIRDTVVHHEGAVHNWLLVVAVIKPRYFYVVDLWVYWIPPLRIIMVVFSENLIICGIDSYSRDHTHHLLSLSFVLITTILIDVSISHPIVGIFWWGNKGGV